MGKTHVPIPFFSDEIAIRPTECSNEAALVDAMRDDRSVSIREFAAGGHRVKLERIEEDGELYCERDDGAFMVGPEVTTSAEPSDDSEEGAAPMP